MTTLTEFIARVEEYTSKATKGPWINQPRGVVQSQAVSKIIFWDDEPNQGDKDDDIKPNYEFIASARTDIEKLVKLVRVQTAALKVMANSIPETINTTEHETVMVECAKATMERCEEILNE